MFASIKITLLCKIICLSCSCRLRALVFVLFNIICYSVFHWSINFFIRISILLIVWNENLKITINLIFCIVAVVIISHFPMIHKYSIFPSFCTLIFTISYQRYTVDPIKMSFAIHNISVAVLSWYNFSLFNTYNLQSTFLRWILHTRQRKITLFIWWVLC